MKATWFFATMCCLGLLIPANGYSRASSYRPDYPIGQHDEWPEGLADLINSGGRVHGLMVNANDFFYFKGDTLDFNKFVAGYARLKGSSLRLKVHDGPGKASGLMRDETIECNWKLSILRRGWAREAPEAPGSDSQHVLVLELWADGDVDVSKVSVPLNLEVRPGDSAMELGGEAQKLITAHDERRRRSGGITGRVKEALQPGEELLKNFSGPAKFRSAKPLYVRLALNEDRSKVLLAAFDESKGTGSGYDLMYVDADFSGTFERIERVKTMTPPRVQRIEEEVLLTFVSGRSTRRPASASMLRTALFPAVKINVPYNSKATGMSEPCRVKFVCETRGGRSSLTVSQTVRMRGEGTIWAYEFSGQVNPSSDLKKAKVCRLDVEPRLKIETRPDKKKQGQIGIGLDLLSGSHELSATKGDQPLQAQVEIQAPGGKVVHRGKEKLSQFGFG